MASRIIHYKVNTKRKVLLCMEENGNRAVAREFDIEETSVPYTI